MEFEKLLELVLYYWTWPITVLILMIILMIIIKRK